MTDPMPRRRGPVRPAALPFSVSLALGALAIPTAISAASLPPAPAPSVLSPTAPKPPAAPVTTVGLGRTLLTRAAPQPMGHNNGVRVWVHGDGSGATLLVRLLQTADPTQLGPTPTWISSPVPLTFTGWREVVLPKSKFTLREDTTAAVDTILPIDAQDGETPDAPVADWSRINALGLELRVPKRASVIVDDMTWVTLDTGGVATAGTPVEDFEKGDVAAWTPGGPQAQQQLLTYGLATQPALVHGGRVAFKMDAVSPAYLRQTVQLAALKKSLTTTGGKTYIVFTPASLFATVLPSSLPTAGTSTSLLSIQACPDQIQAATFCLYSQKPLQDVTVTVPKDLQAIGHALPRTNVDVHVVAVRDQAGAGLLRDPDTAGPVPSLLVKDDRVPLSGTNAVMRLTGAAVTDVPADTTKQFWITVSVPRGAFPGHYTGSLIVSGRGLAPVPVRLDLNVLALRLLSPAKQYGIELRSRLDPAPATLPSSDGRQLATDFVSADILDEQLADITSHGFKITTLYDAPATVWDAVTEYKKYGIMDPYIYKGDGDPATLEAARKDHNAPSFLYYTNPNPVAQTQDRMAALTKGGLLATTYITRQADYDAFQTNLEVPIYNRDSPYAQTLLRTHGQRQSSKRDWWYWPAANSDAQTNRLDTGFLLWRANLYGAFVPAYQTTFGTDPYDENSAGAPAAYAAYRPEMLTYPVQGGVLDTVQWEAAREGVTDVRYLTTLYTALRECKDAKIAKPQTDAAEAYVKALLDKPLATLPDSELDKARAQIATYAVQLRATVDAYNKTHKATP